MTGAFLGLGVWRWVALLTALLTVLLLLDALAGHARRRFHRRVMWTPFVAGGLLGAACGVATVWPGAGWARLALIVAGWVAVAAGVGGSVAHHVYGVAKQPGGYGWLLHHLMYRAPQLAPLGLTAAGALALVAAHGMAGEAAILGLSLPAALLGVVALALVGIALQTAVLHYRGAFNNRAMALPLGVAPLAAGAATWVAVAPSPGARLVLLVLLWATFLVGFVGLGFHLRGFDRMMGGLFLPTNALFEGPPAWAPALYAGFAAVGLVAVHLL